MLVLLLLVVLCSPFAYMAYRSIRYGGARGAALGRRVDETMGEIKVASSGVFATKLAVYTLVAAPAAGIAIEGRLGKSTDQGGVDRVILAISPAQARGLAQLLRAGIAARTRSGG